ncbi:uncharacterized protein PGTG_08018 [Puccinia graminis f. sp. tritici CRL 75-36-700-3]|uniref:CCHC-type domain-containing protein n=1 Tax=Puccinia graminis f. sp. tritici (strain CRL 75-36-700-3 / race SCCL) TaxID=418459 RepID=E3KBW7_PUCGT|nr:uncharacterized protein PGTG_08018 [Puccinia graminis f. sp. tritici CRL 75-36-700-3]EFP81769.2 hypothetical protein PGTG_08018 [Puccinia graminis f. sp. tritici CRL 75-36-700-3]
MSTGIASTGGPGSHRRNSLAGSVTSHGSFEDYVPDGKKKMNELFDSVAGTSSGPNPGDQTIRPTGAAGPSNPNRINRAATAPVGQSTSGLNTLRQQLDLPPHLQATNTNPPPPIIPTPRFDQRPATDFRLNETEDKRDFRFSEMKLKQNKLVSSSVSSIVSGMRKEDALLPDGSNFGQWFRTLKEVSRLGLSDPDFFFKPCTSKTFERIGRAVMLASVHSSLVPDLQAVDTSHKMYLSIKKKFKTVSRAAQMNIWHRFMLFRIDPSMPSAGVAATLLDLYSEWRSVNVSCRSDSFLGFILQAAVVQSGAPYRSDFENRIENAIQNDPNNVCPSFALICNAYDISRQQHFQASEQPSHPAGSVFTPAALLTATSTNEDFDASMFLTGIDEPEWSAALDFFALTAAKCWGCGGDNHYQQDCPQKSRQPGQQSGKQVIGTLVGTIYGQLPSGFQVTSARFPNYSARKSLAPPTVNQHRAIQMADYYRPRYGQSQSSQNSMLRSPQNTKPGGVTAQIVELGVLPDDLDDLDFRTMALGEDVVSDPAVFDTRASHGFKGSNFLLHSFRYLSKPIPVAVATNSSRSKITGIGDLKFRGPNGQVIVLKHVLYCEHARSTLISMAALRKANASVFYDNEADAFKVYHPNGSHLFSCVFEQAKNRWCMPYPMIRVSLYATNL